MITLKLTIQDVCHLLPDNDKSPRKVQVLIPDATRATDLPDGGQQPAHYPYIRFRRGDLAWSNTDDVRPGPKTKHSYWFFKNKELQIENLQNGGLTVKKSFFKDVVSLKDLHGSKGSPVQISDLSSPQIQGRLAGLLNLTQGTLETAGLCPRIGEPEEFQFIDADGKPNGKPRRLAYAVRLTAQVDDVYLRIQANPFGTKNPTHLWIQPSGPDRVVEIALGNSPLESIYDLDHIQDFHTTRDFEIFVTKLWDDPPENRLFPAKPKPEGLGGGPTDPGSCCPCSRG